MKTGRRLTRNEDGSYDEHYPARYVWYMVVAAAIYILFAALR